MTPLAHIAFWVGVYFFYAYFLGYGSTNTKYVNLFSTFLMPVTIIISYFFIYRLIPNYLLQKKYGLFILYTIYTVILSVFVIVLSILYGLVYTENLKADNTSPLTKTIPFIVLGVFFVTLIVVSINLIVHSYKSAVTNENLKNKILQTQLQLKEQELKFLKMQIHPHFLFNSLNTIYGYALKKGDDAPEMILKLSNLLDYILYQIDKPRVLLRDELNHMHDYVSLERMRFHDTLEVKIENNIANDAIEIAPMLLIPFVENSFKHGTIIDGKLTVVVKLKFENGILNYKIINSSIRDDEKSGGIGLENIKKRLNMLYPDKHSIEISQQKNQFIVVLKIHGLSQL
jgi:two-component system LytT family sensor kinase